MVNKQYIVLVCTLLVMAGCCKKDDSPPDENKYFLNSFDYCPMDNNTQWIYQVYKAKTGGGMAYLYDDTLTIVKDSNILAPSSTLYFKYIESRKMKEDLSLVLGIYPMEDQALLIMLRNKLNNVQTYPLYNLSKIIDDGASVSFSTDGAPFDTRYTVSYSTPFISCNTYQGVKKGIFSKVDFRESVGGGSISRLRTFKFAKDVGLYNMDLTYQRANVSGLPDSLSYCDYRLIKVLK